MKPILKQIQSTVSKYANVISEIIGVDVEIVDSDFIRIAGTGIYKNRVNEDMSNEGYVYKTALNTGKTQVIYNPGKNEICIPCSKRDTCEEKLEMCTPIKLQKEIIGVIGLICSNDSQKAHLMSNFDLYITFLDQIAEFISMAAYENTEKDKIQSFVDTLNIVINKLDQGVIIFDDEGYITHINKNGIKELGFFKDLSKCKVEVKTNGDSLFDMQEYKLIIDNKSFDVLGNIHDIYLENDKYDKMFFFQNKKSFNEKISSLTSFKNIITVEGIVSKSPKIEQLKKEVKKIATSISTVLITGESGTGKEMFSRAIHYESDRENNPFIAINCGAIPEALLESELFGYVKGAFTGADPMGKIGKFELANKGSIFLDEIGDMPIYLQTKLLRVLQERKITRIGSNKTIDIDVRVIAATNKNLKKMIYENKFREDLYYRLNVIPLEIPSLREREEDIGILVDHFVEKYLKLLHKSFHNITIEKEVWNIFKSYSWPGNVRELENTVEFIINMVGSDGIVNKNIIPRNLLNKEDINIVSENDEIYSLKEIEKRTIIKALMKCGNSTEGKKRAAKKLGIGIATLYRKIEEYELSK